MEKAETAHHRQRLDLDDDGLPVAGGGEIPGTSQLEDGIQAAGHGGDHACRHRRRRQQGERRRQAGGGQGDEDGEQPGAHRHQVHGVRRDGEGGQGRRGGVPCDGFGHHGDDDHQSCQARPPSPAQDHSGTPSGDHDPAPGAGPAGEHTGQMGQGPGGTQGRRQGDYGAAQEDRRGGGTATAATIPGRAPASRALACSTAHPAHRVSPPSSRKRPISPRGPSEAAGWPRRLRRRWQ